jgi:hypothetical protein
MKNIPQAYRPSYLWFWPPLILGGFSNFCRYYTRSQAGKSTGYRPTLKPLQKTLYTEVSYIKCIAAPPGVCEPPTQTTQKLKVKVNIDSFVSHVLPDSIILIMNCHLWVVTMSCIFLWTYFLTKYQTVLLFNWYPSPRSWQQSCSVSIIVLFCYNERLLSSLWLY